jgi:hypothetical protein
MDHQVRPAESVGSVSCRPQMAIDGGHHQIANVATPPDIFERQK